MWATIFGRSRKECSDESPTESRYYSFTPQCLDEDDDYHLQQPLRQAQTKFEKSLTIFLSIRSKVKSWIHMGKADKSRMMIRKRHKKDKDVKQPLLASSLSYDLISAGQCPVRMLRTEDKRASLVIVAENDDGSREGKVKILNRPVYLFAPKYLITWKSCSQRLLEDLSEDGVYLCALNWKIKKTSYIYVDDGTQFTGNDANVLHCVCKEPSNRFHGRIGPIDKFVPHITKSKQQINGVWVSLWDDPRTPDTTGFIDQQHKLTMEQLRMLQRKIHKDINQIMFYVSKDGACVGIQVMHTKQQEQILMKHISKAHFHHERPLILDDGFYLLEGIFQTNFLNFNKQESYDNSNDTVDITPECFKQNNVPKMVIIGEGTHLIRTVTVSTQSPESLSSSKNVKTTTKWTRIGRKKTNRKKRKNSPKVDNGDEYCLLSPGTDGTDESDDFLARTNSFDAEGIESGDEFEYKLRKIEVCLDLNYSKLIMLDYNQISMDFRFTVNN